MSLKTGHTIKSKMGCIFLSAFFIVLFATVECRHGDHSHHNDDKWIQFVSHIQSIWKTDVPEKASSIEFNSKSPFTKKDFYTEDKTSDVYKPQLTTASYVQNGTTTFKENVANTFKMSLAAIVSIPIVGIIVLCCCCYCICKCCCGMCTSDDDKVIVVHPNTVQPQPAAYPQPTQIIVQQPIYQNMPPPHQEMQQYPPAHQQWGCPPPQFQQPLPPQYFPKDGIDNPNFYPASAPPHCTQEKY